MKALTMWQPHASLLATGIRTIETRGWSTTYRGPLVIHAARKWDLHRAADWQRACSFAGAFVIATDARHALLDLAAEKTLGCALGVVDLVDCRPIPEPPAWRHGQRSARWGAVPARVSRPSGARGIRWLGRWIVRHEAGVPRDVWIMIDTPPDMSEVFAATRDDHEPAGRTVETRPVHQGMGPVVVHSTAPFRKYVPPPLAPSDPESESRSRWRLDRFKPLGIMMARVPYSTPQGLRWSARLLWPGGEWNPKKTENHDRHFAVSLDNGTWSHVGTHQQERPFAELAGYLEGLGLPRYIEAASLDEVPAETSSSAEPHSPQPTTLIEADLAPLAVMSPAEPTPAAPPLPAAPAADDHAEFLAECKTAGLEIEPAPWDAQGTSYRARFRGLPLTVHPRTRSTLFGVKVSSGRCYTPMSLAQAIEAIDSELARPTAHSPLPESKSPGGLSPVRPSTPETGLATPPDSPLGSADVSSPAEDKPERDERPLSEPPRRLDLSPTAPSAPPWIPAASAAGTGRIFRTLSPIPRIGGSIPAGIDLELLDLHGDRGNFARGGRLVLCDCPLDHFTEVLCA